MKVIEKFGAHYLAIGINISPNVLPHCEVEIKHSYEVKDFDFVMWLLCDVKNG